MATTKNDKVIIIKGERLFHLNIFHISIVFDNITGMFLFLF